MGIEDRDRTSVHEIRCRDRLWQTFVQMSEEQDKPVEELINDAMTGYAQIAGYETAVHAQTPPPSLGMGATPPPALRGARPQPFIPPAPGRFGRPTAPAARAPGSMGAPPLPDSVPGPSMLYLVFDNQKYRIDKDQFIIGRGA